MSASGVQPTHPVRWPAAVTSKLSDERLARMIARGSTSAFSALYERYHQQLYRYCRSLLRSHQDAEDALQATFAGVFTALSEGRRDAPMRPWLYRIAHNESVSVLRRRRPELTLEERHEALAPSAAESVAERQRLQQLLNDLSELSERQRAALVMKELSGLSHAEIAAALGVELGAAKQTVFEARRSLAEFSEGREMKCDAVCRAISEGNGRTLRSRKLRAHLRECGECAAFAAAIRTRTRDLKALVPALPGAAASALLLRVLATRADPGAGTGAGPAAGAAAGMAGKAAGVSAMTKTIAGAVLVTAAAGTAVALHAGSPATPSPSAFHARTAAVVRQGHARRRQVRARLGSTGLSSTRGQARQPRRTAHPGGSGHASRQARGSSTAPASRKSGTPHSHGRPSANIHRSPVAAERSHHRQGAVHARPGQTRSTKSTRRNQSAAHGMQQAKKARTRRAPGTAAHGAGTDSRATTSPRHRT
jgi:RNA polymerase sigma factor (sigma-70 family)